MERVGFEDDLVWGGCSRKHYISPTWDLLGQLNAYF